MANYYLRFGQRITGPHTADQLRSMAASGKITGLYMLSQDKRQWTTADQVKGLFEPPADESAPPPPAYPYQSAQVHPSPQADAGMKYCRTCDNPVYENAIVCTKCGIPPRSGKAYCYNCGGATQPGAIACVTCGRPLRSSGNFSGVEEPTSLWGFFAKCLKNYVTFSGRARRREYWGFSLFSWLFTFLAPFLVGFLFGFAGSAIGDPSLIAAGILIGNLVSLACNLGFLLPSLAVIWRRLHDTGRSGVYFLLFLIPLAGVIIWLVFMCQDSVPGDNEYGPNPKGM